jgi:hypothetical protein
MFHSQKSVLFAFEFDGEIMMQKTVATFSGLYMSTILRSFVMVDSEGLWGKQSIVT